MDLETFKYLVQRIDIKDAEKRLTKVREYHGELRISSPTAITVDIGGRKLQHADCIYFNIYRKENSTESVELKEEQEDNKLSFTPQWKNFYTFFVVYLDEESDEVKNSITEDSFIKIYREGSEEFEFFVNAFYMISSM